MADDKNLTKPESTAFDYVHLAVKSALSAIPLVGGPFAEVFAAFITPPLSKRRDQWFELIAKDLKILESRTYAFSVESLKNDDTFITVVMHATQIAIRTHQKEKLEALRNAVINVATHSAPGEDLQILFLNFIDALTVLHLRALSFFANPNAVIQDRKDKGLTTQQEKADRLQLDYLLKWLFPEFNQTKSLYKIIMKDLQARELISITDFDQVVLLPFSRPLEQYTTDMGNQFISFITSPNR